MTSRPGPPGTDPISLTALRRECISSPDGGSPVRVVQRDIIGFDDCPHVVGVTFVECAFDLVRLEGALFESCAFDRCTFREVGLLSTLFTECTFTQCEFRSFHGVHAGFRESEFTDCSFYDVAFETSLFVDVKIFNCIWDGGSLIHTCFDHCSITRTSFSQAVVDGAFRRCEIDASAFAHILAEDSAPDVVNGDDREPSAAPTSMSAESDPLAQYEVAPGAARRSQLQALDELLATEEDESRFQTFLQENSELIAATQSLGHHGIYVIPEVPFGNKHRADFMIGFKNSMGTSWVALEIESPRYDVTKADGHFTAYTNHAIEQIDACTASS